MGLFNYLAKKSAEEQEKKKHSIFHINQKSKPLKIDIPKSKLPKPVSMKKGGVAKMTAPHLLHKGELVLPAHVVKKMSSLM